jgi:hypothetical protein
VVRRAVVRLEVERERPLVGRRAVEPEVRDDVRVPPVEAARGRDAVLVATPGL